MHGISRIILKAYLNMRLNIIKIISFSAYLEIRTLAAMEAARYSYHHIPFNQFGHNITHSGLYSALYSPMYLPSVPMYSNTLLCNTITSPPPHSPTPPRSRG